MAPGFDVTVVATEAGTLGDQMLPGSPLSELREQSAAPAPRWASTTRVPGTSSSRDTMISSRLPKSSPDPGAEWLRRWDVALHYRRDSESDAERAVDDLLTRV
jgi:hypothetical protein